MLFNSIVFGPLKSRRLGLSLGINLLPAHCKLCNFECLYCECGWTGSGEHRTEPGNIFHTREEVKIALYGALVDLNRKATAVDSITFAGNGEPTMHPEINTIMDDVIALRNCWMPGADIVVLSNALLASRGAVKEALMKADRRILKLDAGNEEMLQLLDQPNGTNVLPGIMRTLCAFKGDLEIQTMFVQGEYNGKVIDNTTEEELDSWLSRLKEIRPGKVLIYSLDRPSPAKGLVKVSQDKLELIGERVKSLGIAAKVYV